MNRFIPLWFLPLLCLVILFTLLVKVPDFIEDVQPILSKDQREQLEYEYILTHEQDEENENTF